MEDSAFPCLKVYKEDQKMSTWFKDHIGVFKELMGKDREIQNVIKNTSTERFIAVA